MARGADLFVVCKNCGSEVSPYVTECPYCGQQVRKRAPKLDRGGVLREPAGVVEPGPVRAKPRRRRVRVGQLPGFSADLSARPYATIVLVAASFVMYLLVVSTAVNPLDAVIAGKIGNDWWRPFTAPFVHYSGGSGVFAGGAYQFATMIGVGVFGWLLERRHGPLVVVGIYLLAGAGAMVVESLIDPTPFAAGANGLALGLLCAWAMPDLLAWRRGDDWEGDLLGTAVIAAVLLLMPLAVSEASAVVGFTGALVGLAAGLPLARLGARSY